MKKILNLALAAAMAAALALPASAQEGAMGAPPQIQEMADTAGKWTVTVKARMNADSEWTETQATATIKPVLGGSALMEEFEGTMMGMPLKGLSIVTFDRETNQYQATWTDNMSASTMLMKGEMQDGVLVMKGAGKMMGQDYVMKTKSKEVSANERTMSMHMSFDGGESWFETMQMVYTRGK